MWHEARRQEKQLRARLVDCSKRAERRRKYYDNVRRDPDQFMQIHGRKSVIHADKNVARAAEDANILRKWQGDGDEDVMIDRFDARSHLDYVPQGSSDAKMTEMEQKEEMLCNFERYRLLVMNSFKDIPEKNVLKNITDKEFWMSSLNEDTRKTDPDRKKKSQDGKNSIGMYYEDTEVVRGGDDGESSNEEDMDVEELDVDLEVYLCNPDAQKKVNKIGEGFGVQDSHFVALFRADQQAQKNAAELRRIERQKVLVAGRDGKQERQMLKKQRAMIVGRGHCDDATTTLSSLRANATQKKTILDEGSSSSSEEEPAKAEFITSFGGDGSDVEKKKKKSHRRKSPERSRRKRSRSRSRERRHSRSRNRRSRSRSRSRDRYRKSRSRRSRSRSPRRRRSRSSSRRSSSSDRPLFGLKKPAKAPPPVVMEVVPPASSSDDSGAEELLKITSSMSESEKERIEIENRKRRVRRTKRLVKEQKTTKSRDHESDEDDNAERAKKVKQKMKKALKQTVEEFKEEEEERKKELLREKRVREELNFIEEQERRLREHHRRQVERDRERKAPDSHRRRRRSSSNSSDDRRRRRR